MVSIITVNYNQTQVTLELLQSLENYNPDELEVIVVDNGSRRDETQILKQHYPATKVIRSATNLGFAGGNNLGLQHARGEYIFFLNNDTVVPKGTISSLKKVLDTHTDAAVVCPLIYYYDQPDTVQYAGFTPINPITGRNKALGYKEKLRLSSKVTETHYAHGAAMMIRKDVIKAIGTMPEHYFLYYEELDWIHQIKEAGHTILVDHSCHILHKESISTGKASPLKTYFQTRNRILFMRRNFKGIYRLLFYLFFTLVAIPKHVITCALQKKYDQLNSFLAGVKWNLRNSTTSQTLGYEYDSLRNP